MPNNNNSLNRKGTTAIKRTLIGKQLRNMLMSREQQENDAIIERFKKVLLTPKTTRADLFMALKPTQNSTISADILITCGDGTNKLLKFSDDGSIIVRSLTKPLRDAYKEAEAIKRAEYEKAVQEKFNEREDYTPEELLKFNERLMKAQTPFKGKFADNAAAAA